MDTAFNKFMSMIGGEQKEDQVSTPKVVTNHPENGGSNVYQELEKMIEGDSTSKVHNTPSTKEQQKTVDASLPSTVNTTIRDSKSEGAAIAQEEKKPSNVANMESNDFKALSQYADHEDFIPLMNKNVKSLIEDFDKEVENLKQTNPKFFQYAYNASVDRANMIKDIALQKLKNDENTSNEIKADFDRFSAEVEKYNTYVNSLQTNGTTTSNAISRFVNDYDNRVRGNVESVNKANTLDTGQKQWVNKMPWLDKNSAYVTGALGVKGKDRDTAMQYVANVMKQYTNQDERYAFVMGALDAIQDPDIVYMDNGNVRHPIYAFLRKLNQQTDKEGTKLVSDNVLKNVIAIGQGTLYAGTTEYQEADAYLKSLHAGTDWRWKDNTKSPYNVVTTARLLRCVDLAEKEQAENAKKIVDAQFQDAPTDAEDYVSDRMRLEAGIIDSTDYMKAIDKFFDETPKEELEALLLINSRKYGLDTNKATEELTNNLMQTIETYLGYKHKLTDSNVINNLSYGVRNSIFSRLVNSVDSIYVKAYGHDRSFLEQAIDKHSEGLAKHSLLNSSLQLAGTLAMDALPFGAFGKASTWLSEKSFDGIGLLLDFAKQREGFRELIKFGLTNTKVGRVTGAGVHSGFTGIMFGGTNYTIGALQNQYDFSLGDFFKEAGSTAIAFVPMGAFSAAYGNRLSNYAVHKAGGTNWLQTGIRNSAVALDAIVIDPLVGASALIVPELYGDHKEVFASWNSFGHFLIEKYAESLAMQLSNYAQNFKAFASRFDANSRIYGDLYGGVFTKTEFNDLKKFGINNFKDFINYFTYDYKATGSMQPVAINTIKKRIDRIMKDADTLYTTKMKLASSFAPDYSLATPTIDSAWVVVNENNDQKVYLETYDAQGNPISKVEFGSKQEAINYQKRATDIVLGNRLTVAMGLYDARIREQATKLAAKKIMASSRYLKAIKEFTNAKGGTSDGVVNMDLILKLHKNISERIKSGGRVEEALKRFKEEFESAYKTKLEELGLAENLITKNPTFAGVLKKRPSEMSAEELGHLAELLDTLTGKKVDGERNPNTQSSAYIGEIIDYSTTSDEGRAEAVYQNELEWQKREEQRKREAAEEEKKRLETPATIQDYFDYKGYGIVPGSIAEGQFDTELAEFEQERKQSISYANGEGRVRPKSFDFWKDKLGLSEPKVKEPIGKEEPLDEKQFDAKINDIDAQIESATTDEEGRMLDIVVDKVGENGKIIESHVKGDGRLYHKNGEIVFEYSDYDKQIIQAQKQGEERLAKRREMMDTAISELRAMAGQAGSAEAGLQKVRETRGRRIAEMKSAGANEAEINAFVNATYEVEYELTQKVESEKLRQRRDEMQADMDALNSDTLQVHVFVDPREIDVRGWSDERRKLEQDSYREGQDDINGWTYYDENTGVTHVFIPAQMYEGVKSKQYQETKAHEIFQHYGLEKLLGKEQFGNLMRELWTERMDDKARERYSRYVWDYNFGQAHGKRNSIVDGAGDRSWSQLTQEEKKAVMESKEVQAGAADEWAANRLGVLYAEGKGLEFNHWYSPIVAAIRSGLRKMGIDIKMSDNDLVYQYVKVKKMLDVDASRFTNVSQKDIENVLKTRGVQGIKQILEQLPSTSSRQRDAYEQHIFGLRDKLQEGLANGITPEGYTSEQVQQYIDTAGAYAQKEYRDFNPLKYIAKGGDMRSSNGDLIGHVKSDGSVRYNLLTYHPYYDVQGNYHEGTRAKLEKYYTDERLYGIEVVDHNGESSILTFSKEGLKSYLIEQGLEFGTTELYNKWLGRNLKSGKVRMTSMMTLESFNQMMKPMDVLHKYLKEIEETGMYMNFSAWSMKQPDFRTNDGQQWYKALSSLVTNGEYPVNLELSTDCVRRESYTRVLNYLTQMENVHLENMSPEKTFEIKRILSAYGLTTACDLCFVEAKRVRIVSWATKFLNDWNKAVRMYENKHGLPHSEPRNFGSKAYEAELLNQDVTSLPRAKRLALEQLIESNNWIIQTLKGEIKYGEKLTEEEKDFNESLARAVEDFENSNEAIRARYNKMREEWVSGHKNKDGKPSEAGFDYTKQQREIIDELDADVNLLLQIKEKKSEHKNAYKAQNGGSGKGYAAFAKTDTKFQAEIKSLEEKVHDPNALIKKKALEKIWKNEWAKGHGTEEGFTLTEKQIIELNEINNAGSQGWFTKAVNLIEQHPEMARPMTLSEMLGSNGLDAIRKTSGEGFSRLWSLILQRSGTGTPKPLQGDTPYAGDLLDITDAVARKANAIGGDRLQSFSDFKILYLFDYLQLFADMQAREQINQTYSKELPFVKLFGGAANLKINVSLLCESMMPDAWKEDYWTQREGETISEWEKRQKDILGKVYSFSGLRCDADGKILRDANGKLMMANLQRFHNRHSAPVGAVMQIAKDPNMNRDVNGITVGLSVNHCIYNMMQYYNGMVIPYHASGMPFEVARKTDVYMYRDFTKWQTTGKIADGERVSLGKDDTFNFYDGEMTDPNWDMRTKVREYVDWCNKNKYIPKFDMLMNAENYKKWCESSGEEFVPEFYEEMKNNSVKTEGGTEVWNQYYKVITDFNCYQTMKDGRQVSAPHEPIKINWDILTPRIKEVFKGGGDMEVREKQNRYLDENMPIIANQIASLLNGEKTIDEILKETPNATHEVHNSNAIARAQENPELYSSTLNTTGSGNEKRYSFIGEKGAESADHAEEVTTRLDNLGVAREMEEAKKDARITKKMKEIGSILNKNGEENKNVTRFSVRNPETEERTEVPDGYRGMRERVDEMLSKGIPTNAKERRELINDLQKAYKQVLECIGSANKDEKAAAIQDAQLLADRHLELEAEATRAIDGFNERKAAQKIAKLEAEKADKQAKLDTLMAEEKGETDEVNALKKEIEGVNRELRGIDTFAKRVSDLKAKMGEMKAKGKSVQARATALITYINDRMAKELVRAMGAKDFHSLMAQLRAVANKNKDENHAAFEQAVTKVNRVATGIEFKNAMLAIEHLLATQTRKRDASGRAVGTKVDYYTAAALDFAKAFMSSFRGDGFEFDRDTERHLCELIVSNKKADGTSVDSEGFPYSKEDVAFAEAWLKNERSGSDGPLGEAVPLTVDEVKQLQERLFNEWQEFEEKKAGIQYRIDNGFPVTEAEHEFMTSGFDAKKMATLQAVSYMRAFAHMKEAYHDARAAESRAKLLLADKKNSGITKELKEKREAYNAAKEALKADKDNKALKAAVKQAKAEYNEAKRVACQYVEDSQSEMCVFDEKMQEALGAALGAASTLQSLISGGKDRFKENQEAALKQRAEFIRMAYQAVTTHTRNPETHKEIDAVARQREAPGSVAQFIDSIFFGVARSFQHMLTMIDINHFAQKGPLYHHLILGERGFHRAFTNLKLSESDIDSKLRSANKRFFGNEDGPKDRHSKVKFEQIWIDEEGRLISSSEQEGTKGDMLSVYLWSRSEKGLKKLRAQGYSKDSIDQIMEGLGEKWCEYGDWLVEEFLPSLYKKYNERYVEMYGTDLTKNENYFPFKIFSQDIISNKTLDEMAMGGDSTFGNTPSALKERTNHNYRLDTGYDAFDILEKHIREMEDWYHYAHYRQDIAALLNSRAIARELDKQGKFVYRRLKDAAIVASGMFDQKISALDRTMGSLNKMFASSAIAFRIHTAIKQLQSIPAFYMAIGDPKFMAMLTKNIVSPLGLIALPMNIAGLKGRGDRVYQNLWTNFKWCYDNLPEFKDRVSNGAFGEIVFENSEGNLLYDKFIKKVSVVGMAANKLMDAVAVCIGAKTVYDYKYNKYLKEGYDKVRASNMAKMDACDIYNQSQQSSLLPYKSPIQASRSVIANLFTRFMTSPIGYLRKTLQGAKDVNTAIRLFRDGVLSLGQASKKSAWGAANMLFYGVGGNFSWSMLNAFGLTGIYHGLQWLFGTDDAEDDKMPKDIDGGILADLGEYAGQDEWKTYAALMYSWLAGTPAGNAIDGFVSRGEYNPNMFFQWISDMSDNYKMDGIDKQIEADNYDEATKWVMLGSLKLLFNAGIGVDFNTLTNFYKGTKGMTEDGVNITAICYLLSSPVSHRKEDCMKRGVGLWGNDGAVDIEEYIARRLYCDGRIDVENYDSNWLDKFISKHATDRVIDRYIDEWSQFKVYDILRYKSFVLKNEGEYQKAKKKLNVEHSKGGMSDDVYTERMEKLNERYSKKTPSKQELTYNALNAVMRLVREAMKNPDKRKKGVEWMNGLQDIQNNPKHTNVDYIKYAVKIGALTGKQAIGDKYLSADDIKNSDMTDEWREYALKERENESTQDKIIREYFAEFDKTYRTKKQKVARIRALEDKALEKGISKADKALVNKFTKAARKRYGLGKEYDEFFLGVETDK